MEPHYPETAWDQLAVFSELSGKRRGSLVVIRAVGSGSLHSGKLRGGPVQPHSPRGLFNDGERGFAPDFGGPQMGASAR